MLVISNGIAEVIGCIMNNLLENSDEDLGIDILGNRLIQTDNGNILLNTDEDYVLYGKQLPCNISSNLIIIGDQLDDIEMS